MHPDQVGQLVVVNLGEGDVVGAGPLLGELFEGGRYYFAGPTPCRVRRRTAWWRRHTIEPRLVLLGHVAQERVDLQSARTTLVERSSCSKCSWERISMTDMIGAM